MEEWRISVSIQVPFDSRLFFPKVTLGLKSFLQVVLCHQLLINQIISWAACVLIKLDRFKRVYGIINILMNIPEASFVLEAERLISLEV